MAICTNSKYEKNSLVLSENPLSSTTWCPSEAEGGIARLLPQTNEFCHTSGPSLQGDQGNERIHGQMTDDEEVEVEHVLNNKDAAYGMS